MPRINKYLYLWVVQGRYPGPYGWEDVTAEDTFTEGWARLREYRENEPQYPHRLIHRREPNPEYPGPSSALDREIQRLAEGKLRGQLAEWGDDFIRPPDQYPGGTHETQ